MSYVHTTQADERTMWNLFFQAIQAQSASEAQEADDLTKLFRHYDADGSGRLEADELARLVKHMALVTNQWLDPTQVNNEVQRILRNSNPGPTGGSFPSVTVQEFRSYACQMQQQMTELIRYPLALSCVGHAKCKHLAKVSLPAHMRALALCLSLRAGSAQ